MKHRTPDLKTPDKKPRTRNVWKIEESAGILLVKSQGCRNKMEYFGNYGEIILLSAPSHPLSPLG
jgi:hypothetical protein